LRAKGTTTDTLGGYFSSLVSKVGADSAAAETAYEYSSALASDLSDKQESFGGVNEDEEMTALLRQQQNYQSASKMIQISLEMMDTILGLAG